MLTYIKSKAVRRLVKENKKQATREFLEILDRRVYNIVVSACQTWNGNHTRLTGDLIRK